MQKLYPLHVRDFQKSFQSAQAFHLVQVPNATPGIDWANIAPAT